MTIRKIQIRFQLPAPSTGGHTLLSNKTQVLLIVHIAFQAHNITITTKLPNLHGRDKKVLAQIVVWDIKLIAH